jgi:hypothetical protein
MSALTQTRCLLFVESENLIPTSFLTFWLADHIPKLQSVLTSKRHDSQLPFAVCFVGVLRNFSRLELSHPFSGQLMSAALSARISQKRLRVQFADIWRKA